jgi:hypothetical protein
MRALLGTWISVTGEIVRAFAEKAEAGWEEGAEILKDSCLDASGPSSIDEQFGRPLPPLDPDRLVAAMQKEFERTVLLATGALNEDPDGWRAPQTVGRVHALFTRLATETFARALELRVVAAEGALPSGQTCGDWTKKYRRMMASDGHWPPQDHLASSGE